MLKVIKFRRDLLLGGLKASKDVHGIDASTLVLTLEGQQRKDPEFASMLNENEKLSAHQIINYLQKAKSDLKSGSMKDPEMSRI